MRTSAPAWFAFTLFLPLAPPAAAQTSITETAGIVQTLGSGYNDWRNVVGVPFALSAGDQVRTGRKARATITFADGSKIELGADAYFTLEDVLDERSSMRLQLGTLRAFVQKLLSRKFEVRTPTAVCSVRGTEFSVQVLSGGRTIVDLFKGLLAVSDNRGNEMLMRPNERLQIDVRGFNVPQRMPSRADVRREALRGSMQREVGLDMTKDQVISAVQREIKLAEYQQGKALVDVFGKRVRLEEYILRPSPNQFKLVVLNKRTDSFNYFYYLGTFNTTLPTDLSQALRQLGGTVDTPPTWYLTGYETGRSNLTDSLHEIALGGHPVDINHNTDPNDNVTSFFNPLTNQFQNVAGHNVYLTLFDRYGLYLDGKLTIGWTGNNLQSYSDKVGATNADPITGAALTAANALLDPNSGQLVGNSLVQTFPDASQIHQNLYTSFTDGSFLQLDNYLIDNAGKVANVSAFSGITSGSSFIQTLQNFNYEQVITGSAFGGRKIDLVVEPKILIQSGLIPSAQ